MTGLIEHAIVAIFILFSHTGDKAVQAKVNSWNLADCNTFAKIDAKDYEERHPGDKVTAYCFPVMKDNL